MYQFNNFLLSTAEKEHLTHITKWANEGRFKSINVKKHKLGTKTIEILLSQLPSNTQLLVLMMNKELLGFCEIYCIDYISRTCYLNIYLDNMDQNFVLHGYNVIGMLCNYIYTIVGLNKITTELLLEDGMTISVFKQRNFKTEVHKRAHIVSAGSYKTAIELALLKSEARP
jgi:hypothetical protein